MNPIFSIRKVLKDAFNAFVDNFTALFIRMLQMYAYSSIFFIVGVVALYGLRNLPSWWPFFDATGILTMNQMRVVMISMLLISIFVISVFCIGLFAAFNLHAQYQRCMWRALHNQEIPQFRLQDFSLQYLGLYFVFAMIVFAGLVVLILPGIYLFLRLQFADMVLVVERGTINHALRRSWDLTRNVTFKVLLLGMINSVLRALFIVGYPLMIAIHASMYKQLVDVSSRH